MLAEATRVLESLAAQSGDRGRVHSASVERWLERSARALREYDLVLLDPPYGDPGLPGVMETLGHPGTLKSGATGVVERRADEQPLPVDGLPETRRVKHGDSMLVLHRVAA